MRSVFFLAVLLLSPLSLCPVHAEPRVLTSIKPLQLLASAITGDPAQTATLLPSHASAHHYSLRPSDMRQLQAAELFYWVGPNLETFLTQAQKHRETATTVALEHLPGLQLRYFSDSDEGTHEQGSLDAHIWLSPVNARVIAQHMAEDLSRLDPAQAEYYQHNLKAFLHELQQLDTELQQRLGGLQHRPYFVYHAAYGYFEAHYGLQPKASFTLGDERQPGAQHLALLRQQLSQLGSSCIVLEIDTDPQLVKTLTQGLAGPFHKLVLDPLASDMPVTTDGYLQWLRQIGTQLADCLEQLPQQTDSL